MAEQIGVGGGDWFKALHEALALRRPRIQKSVISWASTRPARYPWRQPGKTRYEVLIGELCLSRTTPFSAVHVYHHFLQQFPSLKTLAEAGEEAVARVLHGFDLQKDAWQIRATAEHLLRQGKGEMPAEQLGKVSGLGGESIRVIQCFACGIPLAIVDSNVARVLCRLFRNCLPPQPARGLLQTLGESLLHQTNPEQYNAGLLDLGELICESARPVCTQCPLPDVCDTAGSSSTLVSQNSTIPRLGEETIAKIGWRSENSSPLVSYRSHIKRGGEMKLGEGYKQTDEGQRR